MQGRDGDPEDAAHLHEYARLARTDEGFAEYLARFSHVHAARTRLVESSGNVFLVCSIARLLEGRKHVAVGANSPIPAAAALLACDLSAGETKVSLIGSRKYSHFTRLGDLFDFAAQGRLDAFFLSRAKSTVRRTST